MRGVTFGVQPAVNGVTSRRAGAVL